MVIINHDRIEDLLTQISGRSGDCIEQVSAAFLAFQKAFKANELAGELDDLEKAIRRLKRDRSTWQEIREEKKNKARLVGTAQRVEFAEGRGVSMEALMAMQSEIINLIRNTIFGWEGKVVRPNAFLQEFQTAYCYTTSGPFTGRISRNGPTWASCCHPRYTRICSMGNSRGSAVVVW